MANVLSPAKQAAVVAALCEGSSIRAVERMTGVHRDTIMRLAVRVGEACARKMDATMRDLPFSNVELDEIWGFIGKKQKRVTKVDGPGVGDVWTFVAIDAATKLVPCFAVGKRDAATANGFLTDLSARLRNRVQISTDGLSAYVEAVEQGFGGEVDYAQIVKSYEADGKAYPEGKYSPPDVTKVEKTPIVGNPDLSKTSTSYVERQNLTMRMHMRRLTRLTNAFSKKLGNFKAAVALHFAYYNFVKRHGTLRMTPAMAAGIAKDSWTVADLVALAG